MKRLTLAVIFAATMMLGFTIFAGNTQIVSAVPSQTCTLTDHSCAGTACASGTFFGLVPWYQYLKLNIVPNGKNSYCEPSFQLLRDVSGTSGSSVPLVLLALLEDLVRVAGFVALGYVIWGGVKYTTSQGSPDGTKQAQETILNAIIGLVIAIIASALVSFLGRKISGG